MELPVCRHRGPEVEEGRYQCQSPKILAPHGVAISTCEYCYCRDHKVAPGSVAAPVVAGPAKRKYLGDHIHNALSAVGITPERVDAAIGACGGGCAKRQEMLNKLDIAVREKAKQGLAWFASRVESILGGK